MSKFKPGDIVRCLVDYPHSAGIKVGELAIIVRHYGEGAFYFRNYPEDSGHTWAGSEYNFEPENLIEANE